jgi:hypothetical protein
LEQTFENTNDREKHTLEQMQSSPESVSVQAVDIGQTKHFAEWIQQESHLLLREREAIGKRIRVIKGTLTGLAEMFGPDMVNGALSPTAPPAHRQARRSHPGLTETCRRILMGLSQPVTARRLCDRIEQQEPSLFVRNKHLPGSVAVVLSRLVSYGEVLDTANEGGGRTWLWAADRQNVCVDEHQLSSPVRRLDLSEESSAAGTEA